MKLKEKLSAHNYDFKGVYECEFCNKMFYGSGYSDSNFFENVIPNALCPSCQQKSSEGEKTSHLMIDYEVKLQEVVSLKYVRV